jgi:hypothetical protein
MSPPDIKMQFCNMGNDYDLILESLLALGGKNNPEQDEQAALTTSNHVAPDPIIPTINPTPFSSSLLSPSTSITEGDIGLTYSMPHHTNLPVQHESATQAASIGGNSIMGVWLWLFCC